MVSYPRDWDSGGKLPVIPDDIFGLKRESAQEATMSYQLVGGVTDHQG